MREQGCQLRRLSFHATSEMTTILRTCAKPATVPDRISLIAPPPSPPPPMIEAFVEAAATSRSSYAVQGVGQGCGSESSDGGVMGSWRLKVIKRPLLSRLRAPLLLIFLRARKGCGFLAHPSGGVYQGFVRSSSAWVHFAFSLFVCLFVAFTHESGWFTNALRNGIIVVQERHQKEPLQYSYVTKRNLCSTPTSPTGTFAVQLLHQKEPLQYNCVTNRNLCSPPRLPTVRAPPHLLRQASAGRVKVPPPPPSRQARLHVR
jgi:hypothetical protein